jgi:hypothetical protein
LRGLVTYYVLLFIHLESRKVDIAGITVHPNEQWMQQMARNVTMEGYGTLQDCRYLVHDRDTRPAYPAARAVPHKDGGRVEMNTDLAGEGACLFPCLMLELVLDAFHPLQCLISCLTRLTNELQIACRGLRLPGLSNGR